MDMQANRRDIHSVVFVLLHLRPSHLMIVASACWKRLPRMRNCLPGDVTSINCCIASSILPEAWNPFDSTVLRLCPDMTLEVLFLTIWYLKAASRISNIIQRQKEKYILITGNQKELLMPTCTNVDWSLDPGSWIYRNFDFNWNQFDSSSAKNFVAPTLFSQQSFFGSIDIKSEVKSIGNACIPLYLNWNLFE